MVIGKDSTDGLKLARVFWIGLGRLPKYDSEKFMDNWSPRMETLMRKAGMGYEDFKWFLIWSTRLRDKDGANWGNNYSAEFLRIASDPMHSLEKNFQRMFFEISMEEGYKKLSVLKDVHQKEQEMLRHQQQKAHKDDPPPAPEWDWYKVYGTGAKGLAAARHFTALDKRFPLLEPLEGEEMEDFVDRHFLPFKDNREWRCSQCVYNPSSTGVKNARPMESVCEVHGYEPCGWGYGRYGESNCAKRRWVEVDDEMVQDVVWYGMEERLKWCGECWEEFVACRDEDIIIHAQDNAPLNNLDLVYGWSDYTQSFRFLKFQRPQY